MTRNFSFDSEGRLLVSGQVRDVAAVPLTRDRETWKGEPHQTEPEALIFRKDKERVFHRTRFRGNKALTGTEWRDEHQLAGDDFDESMRIA